jgi:DNA-binding transcriptional MerR regulator
MQQASVHEAELVTVSNAARILELAEGTVRALAARGRLKCQRTTSGQRLFTMRDVLDLRAERSLGRTR